jgi:hypothetical protein
MLMPFPVVDPLDVPQGPISAFLTVILVEFVMVMQLPVVDVMCTLLITVPLCPLMVIGPDDVCWAQHADASTISEKQNSSALVMDFTTICI